MRDFRLVRALARSNFAFAVLLVVWLGVSPHRAQAQQTIPRCTTADQCLSLGIFYYNNDDISDKAVQQFNLVLTRYKKSRDQVESAQYFLASYYQRKYYIELRKQGKRDSASLKAAQLAYRKYTDVYYKSGTGKWLADAFFNLGLVYLQIGDSNSTKNEWSKMGEASWRDKSVYIYEVVWSPNPDDVVNASLATSSLARYALSILYGNSAAQKEQRSYKYGDSFDDKVLQLRRWCQRNK